MAAPLWRLGWMVSATMSMEYGGSISAVQWELEVYGKRNVATYSRSSRSRWPSVQIG